MVLGSSLSDHGKYHVPSGYTAVEPMRRKMFTPFAVSVTGAPGGKPYAMQSW